MEGNAEASCYTDAPSSPFISLVDQENLPPEARKTFPEKLAEKTILDEPAAQPSPQITLSPLKTSRSRVNSLCTPRKASLGSEACTTPTAPSEPTLRDNEGLTVAIDTMEAEKMNTLGDMSFYQPAPAAPEKEEEDQDVDDTCFSTFSEVPNADMTMFAKLGQRTPGKQRDHGLREYLQNRRSPQKPSAQPSTPSRNNNLLNLLDFELPPMPTPKSVPTITVRELESMKSQYQSQISSLTATLSGRAAEVESLKRAVADAERRVGEAQERVREERNAREHAEREKDGWEKRGIEVEEVLQSIREEVINHEKEREQLLKRLDDSERRADDAEARASEHETRALEAEGKVVDQSIMTTAESGATGPRYTAEEVQKQIDEKIATLCRELHAVYKKKHETKVAALKKSYEAKAEKKHAELSKQVAELSSKIATLESSTNARPSSSSSSSGTPVPPTLASSAVDLARLNEQKAELSAQKTRLAALAGELEALRAERSQLLSELQMERQEKGDLVAAVDEMLALQTDEAATPQMQRSAAEEFRRSVSGAASSSSSSVMPSPRVPPPPQSMTPAGAMAAPPRPSGLARPTVGAGPAAGNFESRLRTPGAAGGRPNGMGLAGGAGPPRRSNLLSSIERMGMGARPAGGEQ
ncbi:central kinetochore-associated-domain-containing protein [Phyllosticta citrichinensis]